MPEEIQKMSAWIEDVYLPKLRARDDTCAYGNVIREGSRMFSEHFLQIIWNERFLQPELKTVSNDTLRVIYPGTWNVGAGPDFSGASLVINGQLLRGDVEIHQRTSDWTRHGHGADPNYKNVILHVVWLDDGPAENAPAQILELNHSLLAEWTILLQDVQDACYPYARQVTTGQCAVRWALTDNGALQTILASAGLARLSAKGMRLLRLSEQQGSDQTLYEGFMDCMGFRNNRQPFRELAELVPLERLQNIQDPRDIQALLFGAAGLLPDPTRDAIHEKRQEEVRDLWERWWKLGAKSLNLLWNKNSFRPNNSPHRRLAAAIRWLQNTNLHPTEWLLAQAQSTTSPRELMRIFLTLDDDFNEWNAYRDFKTPLQQCPRLLGISRLKDIAANLYLPFLCSLELANASMGGLSDLARQTFALLAPGQDNRLLTEVTHRFLSPPSRSHELLKRYCHQQGLIDIYRNFCGALGSDCTNCPFGS